MSLVNIKNFVTPVTNPVHLVSIGVVAVMFLILRLSGGGITINTDIETPKLKRKGERQQVRRQAPPSATDNLLMDGFDNKQAEAGAAKRVEKPIWESDTMELKPRRGGNGRTANQGGGLGSIDDMLSTGAAKRAAPPRQKPAQPENSRGRGLAEIEKSLGLK